MVTDCESYSAACADSIHLAEALARSKQLLGERRQGCAGMRSQLEHMVRTERMRWQKCCFDTCVRAALFAAQQPCLLSLVRQVASQLCDLQRAAARHGHPGHNSAATCGGQFRAMGWCESRLHPLSVPHRRDAAHLTVLHETCCDNPQCIHASRQCPVSCCRTLGTPPCVTSPSRVCESHLQCVPWQWRERRTWHHAQATGRCARLVQHARS